MTQNAAIQAYKQQRLQDMKLILQKMRKDAGLTQQDIATALDCTRARIINIEREDNRVFYDIGEMEIVASLCGRLPGEVTRLSNPELRVLAQFATDALTSPALGTLHDCQLPRHLVRYISTFDDVPVGDLHFSPDGTVLASFMDEYAAAEHDEMGWPDDSPPSQKTLICWDAHTGAVIGTKRYRYIDYIVPISTSLVALAYSRPTKEIKSAQTYEGVNYLKLVNPRTGEVIHNIRVPERIGALSVSPDNAVVAAFFPPTTTIGVWDTTNGQQICVLELETLGEDRDTLGALHMHYLRFDQLPQEHKYDRWNNLYQPSSFKLLDPATLAVSFGGKLASHNFYVGSDLLHSTYPDGETGRSIPFPRFADKQTQAWEIAITKQEYNSLLNATELEIHYALAAPANNPTISHTAFTRQLPGCIYQCTILDDGCILASQQFAAPKSHGLFPYQQFAATNIVTGRSVLLNDGGRLKVTEYMDGAQISPTGERIAYWVFSDRRSGERSLRLSIQELHPNILRVDRLTLTRLLHEEAQRRRDYQRELEQQGQDNIESDPTSAPY